MKLRHNKKRNTAFLYETLVKELTKSIVNDDARKKNIVLSILKEHFKKGSVLGNELSLYKDVVESRGLDYNIAEKILHEAKMIYWSGFKNQKVYDEQKEVGDIQIKLEDAELVINEVLGKIKVEKADVL